MYISPIVNPIQEWIEYAKTIMLISPEGLLTAKLATNTIKLQADPVDTFRIIQSNYPNLNLLSTSFPSPRKEH